MIKNSYGLVFNPKFDPLKQELSRADANALIAQLVQAGFIGEAFNTGGYQANLVGENFLNMITFLGCSPQVELTPPSADNWHNFCHIQTQYFEQAIFYKGMNRTRCACPHCGARIPDPLPELSNWHVEKHTISCQKCAKVTPVEQLNWRHGAGFGQFFITIHNIYPNEAVPSDQLMNLLNTFTKAWNYFFYEQ